MIRNLMFHYVRVFDRIRVVVLPFAHDSKVEAEVEIDRRIVGLTHLENYLAGLFPPGLLDGGFHQLLADTGTRVTALNGDVVSRSRQLPALPPRQFQQQSWT